MPLALTDRDKALLAGELGPAPKMAMFILTRMARVYGAHGMIDITGAHIDSTIYVGDAELVEEMPLAEDRMSLDVTKTVTVTQSGWFHVRAEGTWEDSFSRDTGFAQGFTNPVWVTVGNRPVRNLKAAEYSLEWIDKLRAMAEAAPGWRSQWEKDHVFGQFDEARRIYERFARGAHELPPATGSEP